MRPTTLFALLALVPLTACLDFGKSGDDDDDDDDDEEADDTGWDADDTGGPGEADADTDTDTDADADTDTDTDTDSLLSGYGSISYTFEEHLLDAGFADCTVSLVLGDPGSPPADCPDCTYAGTLEVVSADDDCDWPDHSPGEFSQEFSDLVIRRGVNVDTVRLYGHFGDGWLDLDEANHEVSVGSTQATHAGTFYEDGFVFVESFTVLY